MAMDYTVKLRFQFPAHDEVDGIFFEVSANTKKCAINKAKRQAFADGHTGTGKGRIFFKVVENG